MGVAQLLGLCEAPRCAIAVRCLRDAFASVPATEMHLFKSLRAWRTILNCQIDTDNLSRDLLVGMLGFCYTEPSGENECNFNEINSTNCK